MNKTIQQSQYFSMITQGLITSVSGWRKIFKPVTESYFRDKCIQYDISLDDYTLVYYATLAYLNVMLKDFHKKRAVMGSSYTLVLARDTRSTGASLMSAVVQACGDYKNEYGSYIKVVHLGIVCIPQVMVYTEMYSDGFIYCTASHNPVEYNGLKFGGSHGQIISKNKAQEIIDMFYSQNVVQSIAKKEVNIICDKEEFNKSVVAYEDRVLSAVFRQYNRTSLFVDHVSDKNLHDTICKKIRTLDHRPAFILDPNGGARCGEFDSDFFCKLGVPVRTINNTWGIFGHDILPEGKSLMQVKQMLSKLINAGLGQHENFCLAVVCDCDGDRGNMVLFDGNVAVNTQKKQEQIRTLLAQEVFALILAIELAWQRLITPSAKIAVVVNGPTSLRCDIISKYYGCKIFRVEVGEANVVDMAHKLVSDGYVVPIVGEGSNGGCIILPSSGRDPLCSTLSFLKLLILGGSLYGGDQGEGIPAVYEFLATLPVAATTEVDDSDAKFFIPSNIKFSEFIKKVLVEFEKCHTHFEKIFSVNGGKVLFTEVYNFLGGQAKKVDLQNVEISEGGVSITFFGECKNIKINKDFPLGFVWIRPSGTEPVVRLVADAIGENASKIERELITLWRDVLQRCIK